jgi:hypothetical protein
MGVIRKKIAARGGEGGVKYVCDVCSSDITSTVSESLALGTWHIPRPEVLFQAHDMDERATPRPVHRDANMFPKRYESDVPTVPVTNTTFA